jgi:hypothetical protein
MVRRHLLAAALFATVAIPSYVLAHEGHPHKVLGTVSVRSENRLEVKATDGKTATISLNEKTKITRGKTKTTIDDIKPGERIVVTATEKKGADGQTTMIATEVRLPEAAGK